MKRTVFLLTTILVSSMVFAQVPDFFKYQTVERGYSGDLITEQNSGFVRIGNSDVTVIEGQVPFTTASDRRLKKNIRDLSSGLDFILKLNPVEYQMKYGDTKLNFGFIAQDLEWLVGTNNSMLTIGSDDDRTLGLRYTDLIAPIVKAIQEQQILIERVVNENVALKNEIADLKQQLEVIDHAEVYTIK